MALVSCAVPKAIVVESPLAPKPAQAAISEPAAKPKIPALQNDGLRLPDMETMPGMTNSTPRKSRRQVVTQTRVP
jgi:hypothetical protein